MAEEREAPEPDSESAIGGVDPVAIGLALAGASRESACAFLAKQGAFIDDQRHHLHEQLKQLHLAIWEKRLGVLLRVATLVIGLGAVAALAYLVWDAAHAQGLVIEAFSVPPDLAARGLTGEVVATRFVDQFQAMQAATVSDRPADTYQNDWGSELKVEIPDTGLTFGEVGRMLRDRFGGVSRVTGEVVRTPSGISVTARLGDTPPQTFAGAEGDFDRLARQAAQAVYRASQPYRYAMYMDQQGRHDEALAVLSDLATNGPPGERGWAYAQWGLLDLVDHADTKASERHCRKALDIGGGAIETAEICIAGDEYWLAHDENELAITIPLEKLAQIHQPGVTDAFFESNKIVSLAFLENITGDLRQAAKDWIKTEAAPDFLGSSLLAPALAATATAQDHDPAQAARIMAALEHSADTDFLRLDAIYAFPALPAYWIAAERGDWNAAVSDARTVDAALAAGQTAEPLYARLHTVWIQPLLALAMAERGDGTAAAALAAASPGDCYLCLRIRGQIAALSHDAAGADRLFAQAVAQAPSVTFAYADWGHALLERGQLDAAIEKFTLANQKGPHFADPLEGWGEALMAKNQSHLALAKFAQADKYAPNWGRLHLKWGEALVYAGKPADAKTQLARAAALDLTPSEKAELSTMRQETKS
jgi:tetratricopeptide (TPR) repeat protein